MAQGQYDGYVKDPRFGKRPHHTGLNPQTDFAGNIQLHWHSPEECRIPNTAIAADLSRQTEATLPVTHYYDVKRQCRDCGKPFIFFALEQKHWYEDLNFPLEVDGVRCICCRKRQQGIARKRERYEELFHVLSRSTDENLEMAECCLSLIEEGIFNRRQTQQARRLFQKKLRQPAMRPGRCMVTCGTA
jgi:hypothetical protein